MLPSLGVAVATSSLLVRTCAYTAAWATYALVLQILTGELLKALTRQGLVKLTRDPTYSQRWMRLVDWFGYAAWLSGVGFVQVCWHFQSLALPLAGPCLNCTSWRGASSYRRRRRGCPLAAAEADL